MQCRLQLTTNFSAYRAVAPIRRTRNSVNANSQAVQRALVQIYRERKAPTYPRFEQSPLIAAPASNGILRTDVEGWGSRVYFKMPRFFLEVTRGFIDNPRCEWIYRRITGPEDPGETLLADDFETRDWEFPANSPFSFVRLGPYFFLSARDEAELPPGLRTQIKSATITIDDVSSSACGVKDAFKFYTLATLSMILESDLRDMQVIDCGAGDGLLSLLALRRRARQAILIEREAGLCQRAKGNLERSGFQEGRDFVILCGDLRDEPTLRQIPRTTLPTALVVNIGFFPKSYAVDNSTALLIIPRLQKEQGRSICRVILGGYDLDTNANGIFCGSRPNTDLLNLAHYGFRGRLLRSALQNFEAFSVEQSSPMAP